MLCTQARGGQGSEHRFGLRIEFTNPAHIEKESPVGRALD
jgi:hypothetical protein